MQNIRKTVAGVLIAFMAIQAVPTAVYAANEISVTSATGGSAIPVTTVGGTYTSLTGPVLTETSTSNAGRIQASTIGNSRFITLTVPSGFVFDTTSNGVTATVSGGNGSCSTSELLRLGSSFSLSPYNSNPNFHFNVTPGTSTISVRVLEATSGNCESKVTFSGIKVRPTTAGVFPTGNIAIAGDALQGRTLTTHGGTLTVVPGAAAAISVTASSTSVEAPGSTNLQFTVRDAANNLVADGTTISVSSSMGTFVLSGTTVGGKVGATLTSNATGTATLSSGLALTGDTAVTFKDTTGPVITINGSNPASVWVNTAYTDAGATANDAVEGDVSSKITVNTSLADTSHTGSFPVTYSVQDSAGNISSAVRMVDVIDEEKPIITLTGASLITLEAGATYVEPGYTATDNADGDLTASVLVTGVLDGSIPPVGSSTVTYSVSDSSSNSASVTREVFVQDTTAPVITLVGDPSLTVTVGTVYVDAGATANDSFEGPLTPVATGVVDTSMMGDYTITYNVSDTAGNAATPVLRYVHVRPLGTDSSLSALSVATSTLNPVFASSTFNYLVLLPYGTTSVPMVFATSTDSRAMVGIKNAGEISTSSPSATTTIFVQAEDGIASSTYIVVFGYEATSTATTTEATSTPTSSSNGTAPLSGAGSNNGGGSGGSVLGATTGPTGSSNTGTSSSSNGNGGTSGTGNGTGNGSSTLPQTDYRSNGGSSRSSGGESLTASTTASSTASSTDASSTDQTAAVGNSNVLGYLGWILGLLAVLIMGYTGYHYNKNRVR